jgi:hypothetical protein
MLEADLPVTKATYTYHPPIIFQWRRGPLKKVVTWETMINFVLQ